MTENEQDDLDERVPHRIRCVVQETNPVLDGMVTQYLEIDVSGLTHKDVKEKFEFVLENRKNFPKKK